MLRIHPKPLPTPSDCTNVGISGRCSQIQHWFSSPAIPKPSYKSITGISISKEENNPGYIYFIDSSLCLRKKVSLLLLAILCWRYRKKKILYKHSLWLLHFFGLHQEKCFCKVILPKATTITQMKRISHIFCHHLIQFSTSTDTSTSFFASTISQTDVHAEGHFLSIQGQIKSSLLL